MTLTDDLRRQVTTTIRMLAADAVQKADSGHPGAPMGQADLAHVVWHDFMRFDPNDPDWPARDRFVLSCGHASMLLYTLLHLWGFDVTMDDLKSFRQWGSKTPGHPEVGHTPGVEVTTGPLGQGVANSVGMALAAKMMQARVDVPGDAFQVMGQRVFTICSDGDLMEGISSEAASLAGHWRLDNLVWLYDDNRITIDGDTAIAFTEDVQKRFEAFGWRVLHADGHDAVAVHAALEAATTPHADPRPTMIVCRTHIGWGSPNKVDTAGVHGSPLGDTELAATREALGWPEERFLIPQPVAEFFAGAIEAKKAARAEWEKGFAAWRERHPERAALFDTLWSGGVPDDLEEQLLAAAPAAGATRKVSGAVLQAAANAVPGLVGGSADLTGSNSLAMKGAGMVGHPAASTDGFTFDFGARQLHFGIREHAMGAITNGMALHGGLKPFGGTFLVFSDYMRPALRLAALSHLANAYVFTHDSVFLGEDGTTHQPIEHMWALRLIPNLVDFRPADGIEVAMMWAYTLREAKGPVAMALTRQDLPVLTRPDDFEPKMIWEGAHVLSCDGDPEVVLVGTGSEVGVCVEAGDLLRGDDRKVRVVSMPSHNLFAALDADRQEAIIPSSATIVTVEAGVTPPWRALTGRRGLTIGIDGFGASAPAEVIAEKLGLTEPQVADRVRAHLKGA